MWQGGSGTNSINRVVEGDDSTVTGNYAVNLGQSSNVSGKGSVNAGYGNNILSAYSIASG